MNPARTVFSFLTLAAFSGSAAAEYARSDLLIEAAELEAALAEPGVDLVVLHAATPALYFRARVPGAVLVDPGEWGRAFGDGSDAPAWSRRIAAAGVGPSTRVVVYDDGCRPGSHPQTWAARVWWILKYWGVDDAAILNGGLQAWVDHAGAPIPQGDPVPTPGGFVARAQPERLKTTEQMATLANATRVLDVRSAGEVARGVIGVRAEHCEWVEVLDTATGRFKSANELRRVLRLDEHAGEPAVTYCRSGGRAAVTAFALELMGVEQVANYYGSWNEWNRLPDAPIERPGVGAAP